MKPKSLLHINSSVQLLFHSRTSNNMINLLHERTLRVIIKLHHLKEERLGKDNSFTVYHFNIQSLATEMFKVSNNTTATIIGDLLTRSHHSYNLCSKSNFIVPCVRAFIRNMIPDYIKESETLDIFKNKIRK